MPSSASRLVYATSNTGSEERELEAAANSPTNATAANPRTGADRDYPSAEEQTTEHGSLSIQGQVAPLAFR